MMLLLWLQKVEKCTFSEKSRFRADDHIDHKTKQILEKSRDGQEGSGTWVKKLLSHITAAKIKRKRKRKRKKYYNLMLVYHK